MLIVTGKQEEDLVSCNQRVNVMSIEVLEAHKKEEEAKKTVKSLEEKMALLKTEKQQLNQQYVCLLCFILHKLCITVPPPSA